MIPTMLLFGFAIGRWWAIPLGALGWTVLIVAAVPIDLGNLPLAAALGAANTSVGVLARFGLGLALRCVVRLTRLLRAA
jgi:hypothetical protein